MTQTVTINLNKLIKPYAAIGIIYGLGRSTYWLSNLNDSTYTYVHDKDKNREKLECIIHPTTTTSKIYYTGLTCLMSQFIWPVFAFSDLSYYQKNKLGIREITPPVPFESLKWKNSD
jgi:hypothetical protein